MASPIPSFYRHLFTTIEPILATTGALQALFQPQLLLAATVPSVPYSPSLSPLFTQFTGSWLMLAYHDFFVLRSPSNAHDVSVWRHTLAASSISDLFYTISLVQSMTPANFFNPLNWGWMEAIAVVTTVGPFLGKLCFLSGLGVGVSQKKTEVGGKKTN
ncbi:hypothetical protein F5Y16DRAFT_257910 [Xylariaceae sp. FL0255]|nr:hypothetical protein F5Y16DRAFT_257910 [Xylariaceae sp. FL0255]